jgi:hypothetical protein
MIETILINGAAGIVVGGAWIARTLWSSQNGNGKLSKEEHEVRCNVVRARLDRGDKQFDDIMKKIDDNHADTIEHILELTKEVNRK